MGRPWQHPLHLHIFRAIATRMGSRPWLQIEVGGFGPLMFVMNSHQGDRQSLLSACSVLAASCLGCHSTPGLRLGPCHQVSPVTPGFRVQAG